MPQSEHHKKKFWGELGIQSMPSLVHWNNNKTCLLSKKRKSKQSHDITTISIYTCHVKQNSPVPRGQGRKPWISVSTKAEFPGIVPALHDDARCPAMHENHGLLLGSQIVTGGTSDAFGRIASIGIADGNCQGEGKTKIHPFHTCGIEFTNISNQNKL